MQNIRVGRYQHTTPEPPNEKFTGPGHRYVGWLEPEDLGWILFVRDDHTVELYLNRDPETGAVLDD